MSGHGQQDQNGSRDMNGSGSGSGSGGTNIMDSGAGGSGSNGFQGPGSMSGATTNHTTHTQHTNGHCHIRQLGALGGGRPNPNMATSHPHDPPEGVPSAKRSRAASRLQHGSSHLGPFGSPGYPEDEEMGSEEMSEESVDEP